MLEDNEMLQMEEQKEESFGAGWNHHRSVQKSSSCEPYLQLKHF